VSRCSGCLGITRLSRENIHSLLKNHQILNMDFLDLESYATSWLPNFVNLPCCDVLYLSFHSRNVNEFILLVRLWWQREGVVFFHDEL